MSFIDLINEQLSNSKPTFYLTWNDLCEMRVEDVAYASVYDWVSVDNSVFRNIGGNWDERKRSHLNPRPYFHGYKARNVDTILLLCAIKYKFHHKKIVVNNHEIDEEFLKHAWDYAVESGLTDKAFGDAIKSLGYKPPTDNDDTYNDWIRSMTNSRPVKSARKIDN